MKNGEISGESASRRVSAPTGAADISIVVPTLNEADNIKPFIAAIKRVLEPFNWEIVFVDDDSPDGTWKTVQHEAAHDRRIRGIRRVGRHGLASAAIEGFLSSASPVLVLMDGDLQHEEAILPQMISLIADDHADLVVGSRYLPGGSAAGLSQRHRSWLSFLGLKLAKIGLRAGISDPMSGFFAVKRSVVDVAAPNLSGQGFKILADILASAPGPMRIKEIPYVFRQRAAGESKLDSVVVLQFAELVLDKTIGRYIPTPFILFSIVGAVGVLVHLAVLYALLSVGDLTFATAQLVAALCAMTFNFALNNITTYRTARLVGRHFVTGLLIFTVICGAGLLANVGIASFLFRSGEQWWVAGLIGALVGSVWNYAMSRLFVWGRH